MTNIVLRSLRWLGSHELAVLLAAAGIAAGVWAFALLSDEVIEGGTQAFDRRILLAMRHPGDLTPIGPLWLQEAARDITALGAVTVLGLFAAITAGYLALDGKRRMAIVVIGSVASGYLVSTVLKDMFHRARPDIVPHAVVTTASFPSGHSMMSALTYLVLGALLARSQERKALKAYFLLVAAFLSFLVGVTRVYLGVHWPTDVLAGWTAGGVWALFWWLVTMWLQNRRVLERDEQHSTAPSS